MLVLRCVFETPPRASKMPAYLWTMIQPAYGKTSLMISLVNCGVLEIARWDQHLDRHVLPSFPLLNAKNHSTVADAQPIGHPIILTDP
jgi:hypothetical protein